MQGSDKAAVSLAAAPDIDRSQVSEAVRMPNLAAAQISMAMHERGGSVGSLTRSFTDLVVNLNGIAEVATGEQAKVLPDGPRLSVRGHGAAVQSGIRQSTVALQFYDRLSQRLDHVRFALEPPAGPVSDKACL